MVLVVDDNAANRALAKAVLDDEDIPVVLAATGEEGIAAFSRTQPTCVLLDIRMPGMDGVTVCERIRALPHGDRVAIIFVTAQRDVDTFDRALRAGGDDFIMKPFRPSELLARIQTATRLRQMAAERDVLSVELKQQRDELLRLQLHKEQLSSFLVHDLKNPVNAIELHVQRILRPGATMAELERYAIIETLKATGGSTSRAAEMLGISTRTIQYRLHEYNAAPRSEIEAVRKAERDGSGKS